MPEVVSTSFCTFVGGRRREIQGYLGEPLIVSSPPSLIPLSIRGSPSLHTPEPKKVLGHIGLESAFKVSCLPCPI